MQYTVAEAAQAISKSKATVSTSDRPRPDQRHPGRGRHVPYRPGRAASRLPQGWQIQVARLMLLRMKRHEAILRRASRPLKRELPRCKRRRGCATTQSPTFAGASTMKQRSVDV